MPLPFARAFKPCDDGVIFSRLRGALHVEGARRVLVARRGGQYTREGEGTGAAARRAAGPLRPAGQGP